METLADKIAQLGRKCAVCGHEWLKKEHRDDPKRCPNHACRSKDWRGDPKAGESIALREDFGA